MTNKELGNNVRKLRELRGLTQQNLAIEMEVDQKTISRIESGETSPKFETIIELCRILKISLKQLLDFSEENIFNNYSQDQQGGSFVAYNNTSIAQVEKLYQELLNEKDKMIEVLNRIKNTHN